MKKNLILTLFLCLFIICGCSMNTNKNNVNQKQDDQKILGGDRDEHGCIGSAGYSWCEAKQKCLRSWEEACEKTEDLNMRLCDSVVLGLQFSYPKNWGDCKVEDNNIYFRTDFEKYNVDLVGEIKKADYLLEEYGNNVDNEKISENIEVFKIGCGGALSCAGIKVDNHIYEIGWQVSSDQKSPENLDGIWTPDHNITDDQMWNIVKSVKYINK